MKHYKRIVVDFDDTIAFPVNRDWENAKPNTELIQKLTYLYRCGWVIDIFTARGSISCKTRKAASIKYRAGIEKWLKDHNVLYHTLSFDKPLASYYIDDKGITPDEFLKLDIRPLKGGLSSSDIYTDGRLVRKTSSNSLAVQGWYNEVMVPGIHVPKVHGVVGETIIMDYIEHNPDYFKNNFYTALGIIQDTLTTLKKVSVKTAIPFSTYKSRIYDHANASGIDMFKDIASELNNVILSQSFSHGDFGITNMLFQNTKLYLIDPLPTVFGCTELDVAKFVASLHINKYPKQLINITKQIMELFCDISLAKFKLLILAELIRVYKYHSNKNFIVECVKDVLKS